jgi:hypothetical protein
MVTLGLVRLCRIAPEIVPTNQSLYKLEKQSGLKSFRPTNPKQPNNTLFGFVDATYFPKKLVNIVQETLKFRTTHKILSECVYDGNYVLLMYAQFARRPFYPWIFLPCTLDSSSLAPEESKN